MKYETLKTALTSILKFAFPEKIRVESRGVHVDIAVSKLPENILANALSYGLTQKIADAASGAGSPENWNEEEAKLDNGQSGKGSVNPAAQAATVRMMEAAIAALTNGDWSRRGGGEPADPLARFRRSVIRDNLGDKQRATYKAISEAARRDAYLDDLLAKLDDATREAVEEAASELKRIDDEAKAKRKATKVSIKL
jgi:hypothetical protein